MAEKDETPIQRALRLKQAALAAKAEPGGRKRKDGERAAAARSSAKSKPWMKK
jgi:hypothetical protein